jgi:hypothetical protein
MPLAWRAQQLHDYESVRERARTTYELVNLDYYSLAVAVHKGSLTSRDMFWIMTTALGLTVQAMALASAGNNDIKEQQWNVRLKAHGCPKQVGYLIVDDAEVMLHHNTIHVNWPCKRCHSPEHPTKYCKTTDGGKEAALEKHTRKLEGLLPSSLGKSSRDYSAGDQPRTILQLDALLRREGAHHIEDSKEASDKPIKKMARSRSPRKREKLDEKERPTLPAEWRQTMTETEDAGIANEEMGIFDGEADHSGGVVVRGEADGEPGEEVLPDLGATILHGEDIADVEMAETGTMAEQTERVRSPTKPKHPKQRKGRRGKKVTERGRSPTVRPRLSSQEREKQKAAFHKRSTELQRRIDQTTAASAGTSGVRSGELTSAQKRHSNGTRTAASASPKRRAVDEWDFARDYDSEDEDALGHEPLQLGAQTGYPSTQRKVGPADTAGGKTATQKFIHQFMPIVSGAETAPKHQSGI